MGNMSYCRFQNTYGDLKDCEGALEELLNAGEGAEVLSREELSAACHLIEVCQRIVNMVADQSERACKQLEENGEMSGDTIKTILDEAVRDAEE